MLRCVRPRRYLTLIQLRLSYLSRWLRRRGGFFLRLFLCWMFAILVLRYDEVTSYDQRFQLRGPQKVGNEVVVILLKLSDFRKTGSIQMSTMIDINEPTTISDSTFWDQTLWKEFLTQLLKQKPRSIGVNLYFGDNVEKITLTPEEKRIFYDPKIFWSTSVNHMDRSLLPAFTNRRQSNVGSNELRRDDDGVVRRIFPSTSEHPLLVEKLTDLRLPKNNSRWLINYRGDDTLFTKVSWHEIMNNELPPRFLENKIILIGAETNLTPNYQTPFGPLHRVHILAQVVDNLLHSRWVIRYSMGVYAAFLFLIALLAAFIITHFPQSVSLVFFIWIGTLVAAMSAWIFDSFYVWLPAVSTSILLASIWIIFVGYQASKIERKNFVLEQEQKYLHELEQLKNNFVSLISHDLKTPIAKIQAVVDRLLTQDTQNELKNDFLALRSYGDELNRYIQSILQVLRIESREFQLIIEVADINEIIDAALRQLRPLAAEKNIQLTTSLEPIFSVEFDITLMKEVIINLVENAIKYSSPGQEILVKSWEDQNFVHVSIVDHGQGISAEEIEKVWEKFTRGKNQDLKTKGTGLGLYLVKYFVELHGGQVSMESQEGKGTTVSFTLPVSDDKTSLEGVS